MPYRCVPTVERTERSAHQHLAIGLQRDGIDSVTAGRSCACVERGVRASVGVEADEATAVTGSSQLADKNLSVGLQSNGGWQTTPKRRDESVVQMTVGINADDVGAEGVAVSFELTSRNHFPVGLLPKISIVSFDDRSTFHADWAGNPLTKKIRSFRASS
jgi:hypothetical protein